MKISLVGIPVPDPIEAHEIYTTKLGFISREFDPDAKLSIVVSPEDPHGTAILLEPCLGSYAENYQRSAFEANMPIMVLAVQNVEQEFEKMKVAGVTLRPELDRPEWDLENIFEDGCGNLLMLEKISL